MTGAIRPLTAFRFFAALAVFVFHLPDFSTGRRNIWLTQGFTGVSFFFVLSGFILAHTYARRLAPSDPCSLRAFYTARVARIVPSHLLAFLIAVPLFLRDYPYYGKARLAWYAALQVGLVQSFHPSEDAFFAYNMVSWTLSDEMFFYALFPFVLAVARSLPPAAGRAIAAALWFAAFAAVARFAPSLDPKRAYWLFNVFPPFRLVDFACGVLVYTAFPKPDTRDWGMLRRSACEAGALAALAAAYALSGHVPQAHRWGTYYLPFMALVIWTFSFTDGALSRALGAGWLVRLGEWSFGFYLYHYLVLWVMERSGAAVFREHPLAACFFAFAATLAAAAASFALFETPVRERLRRRVSGLPAAA